MKTIILTLLPLITSAQLDKILHFSVGANVGTSVSLLADGFNLPYPHVIGMTTGIAVGVAKEIYDLKYDGNVETADMAVTALGAMIGAFTVKIYINKKKKNDKTNHLDL